MPADQKLTRFMLHLEGPIQNHAQCWLDSREGQIPEYRALVEELRRSFQRTIDIEEAESNLHGRKWNPYEMTIDEFLHDTRSLVQQAYPGEHGRWDAKIRACLCRALPVELERIVASNTRAINDLIEWVHTHTRTIVQGTAPDEDAEGWVHKAYEKYQIKKKPVPKGSTKGEENPKEKAETQIVPRVNNRFGNNACFVCNSNLHQRDSCPHNPQAFRNVPNTGLDPYYGQSVNNAPRFPLPIGTSDAGQTP
ncbi:MAG: hypothetical protein GY820_34200 [Gammaproteobacteria bacterium]|nr:hypothetical protein [Gammaproteobacteria bacterium]